MTAAPQASPLAGPLPGAFAEFCAAGLWPGVDPALARRLAAAGLTGPGDVSAPRLAQLTGVGGQQAADLAAAFEAVRPVYETARLLVACRVPARLAGPAVTRLGPAAPGQLREDPWRLLAVPGLRPDQADWFARRVLGGQADPQDPRRGRAIVGYLLARAARDGHTAVPATVIARALGRLRITDPAAAIAAVVGEGTVLPLDELDPASTPVGAEPGGDGPGGDGRGEPTPVGMVLALARYAMAEEAVAEGVQRLTALAEPLGWTRQDLARAGVVLDEEQQQAVLAVAGHGVSVLCGGPGTGKDEVLAAVVAMPTTAGLGVALAAPTGPAAARLAGLTGAPASTIRQLLGARPGGPHAAGPADGTDALDETDGTAGRFSRTEANPLEAGLIVVDEAGMLDAELAAALVEACRDGSRLLLAGDPAELPSAGPGRVLADLAESGTVPVTELTLVRRPDGAVIARLAAAIRDGRLPAVNAPGREVVVVPARDSAEAARRVIQLVTDSIPRALGIPAGDVQVITPVRDGAAGTVELNRALKARLNPGPGRHRGFDPGDRVVAVADHPAAEFTSGETGTVTGPGDGGLIVAFPAGPVCVPDRLLRSLRHGWALTTRRAQGGSWPAVVAVFPAEAADLLSRPLTYTALTRAQRHLSVVHGAGPALARALAQAGEQPRVTRLAALLSEGPG